MDPPDTTNYYTKEEVSQEYSTWDEYFEKIVVCGCFKCRGKKQFKRVIVQRHYIDDELPMGSMPPTIDSNPIGIFGKDISNFILITCIILLNIVLYN